MFYLFLWLGLDTCLVEASVKLTSLAHVFGGLLTALVSIHNPVLAVLMALTFIIYELDEDWHISDEAFKDIKEFIYGLFIGALIEAVRWLSG